MAELDAVVAECRGRGPFAIGEVRDASNRTNRDWPWWGVKLEHTQVDGSVSRRATAIITLRSTQTGKPGSFEAEWIAQIWQGSGVDTFRRVGAEVLEWTMPTPAMLQDTMTTLLNKAARAIPG
jgi:hypothetical protein